MLRHTFAGENLRQGVPPAVVAKEMGISVDTLMKHYYPSIQCGERGQRHMNRWGLTPEGLARPAD